MSIEKGPEFRIVGGAPPEKKEEARGRLLGALFNHFESLSPEDQEMVKRFECGKSEKEVALINFANEETNRLRQELGLESYNVPHENYHLLPSKIFKKLGLPEWAGATNFSRQGIFIDIGEAGLDSLALGKDLLHETLHLKGHMSSEVEEKDGKARSTIFRAGVSSFGAQRSSHHEHFVGLNEAITATQEKKSFQRMLDLSPLKKEKEWLTSKEARKIRKLIADKNKLPEDELICSGKKKDWIEFSYLEQRRVLDYVCQEIQKEHPQQYQNKDEVFTEFLKAHFTGRLLPIARLVEKTFGEGSFRALGNMSDEDESAVLHMELLRKARAKQFKK